LSYLLVEIKKYGSMKINNRLGLIVIPIILISTFLLGFRTGKSSNEKIPSKIFRRNATKAVIDHWGEMDIYTSGNTKTYGTENMFTALTDVLPGESVHPSHRHGDEEFLLISRGEGMWLLKGDTIQAKSGDLLYADPWDFHGLVNTGRDTLTFFVIKWKNRGMDMPKEPTGDHGN
jgi:mannose-6-phosphate isomerase-like protein (cupin superfamily)